MADPFSFAGSAVGIVPLGLTVCQGLVSYYASYSAYDDEVAETVETIRRLEGLLALLEDVLQRLSPKDGHLVAQVKNCATSCEDRIEYLKAHLDKCHTTMLPSGGSGEMRKLLKRGLFPFRKQVLTSVRDSVESLCGHLQLAIKILQLALSDKQSSDLALLVGASASTTTNLDELKPRTMAIEMQVGNIRTAVTPLGTTLLAMAPVVHNTLPKVQEGVSGLHAKASMHASALNDASCTLLSLKTNLNLQLPAIETKVDQLSAQMARFLVPLETQLQQLVNGLSTPSLPTAADRREVEKLESDIQGTGQHLLQRPSPLKETCDELQRSHSDFIKRSSDRTPSSFGGLRCTCTRGVRSNNYKEMTGSIAVYHSIQISHRSDCPLVNTAKRTTTLGLSFPLSAHCVGKVVEFTVTLSKGAGAFSISPSLNLRAIVPRFSPAFKLIRKLLSANAFERTCADFEDTARELTMLFQNRGASPTDTDEEGDTLLTLACSSRYSPKRCGRDIFESYRALLLHLVSLSVPVDAVDSWGQSVLDVLFDVHVFNDRLMSHDAIDWSRVSSLVSALADRGADWINLGTKGAVRGDILKAVQIVEWLARFEDVAEGAKCGKLSRTILSRSVEEVKRLLDRFSAPLDERDQFGFTPLHLAANQPEMLALLLNAGFKAVIDKKDNHGFPPVVHAGARNNLAAVRLFLNADCALLIHDGAGKGPYLDVLDVAIRYSWHGDVLQVLIDALAERRRRLWEVASTVDTVRRQLNLQSDTILLDEQAYSAYKSLREHGISVPAAIRCPQYRTTVYHGWLGCGRKTRFEMGQAERIYEAGFHDIDGLDRYGWTPLADTSLRGRAILDAIQLTFWLLEKGANLARRLPECPKAGAQEQPTVRPWTTAAHVIASDLGKGLPFLLALISSQRFKVGNQTGVVDLWPCLGHDGQRLLAIVSAIRIFDSCRCACSTSGCSPAANLMKSFKRSPHYRPHRYSNSQRHLYNTSLYALQRSLTEKIAAVGGTEEEASVEVALELIRLKTFEELELTHTCCEGDHDRWEPEHPVPDDIEIDEIQEEERYTIAQLEGLVAEFGQEFNKRQEALLTFFDGYWKRRMTEVLAKPTPLDKEAIRQAEEVGIVIQR